MPRKVPENCSKVLAHIMPEGFIEYSCELNKMALCEVLFLFLQLSVYVLITQRRKFFNNLRPCFYASVLAFTAFLTK